MASQVKPTKLLFIAPSAYPLGGVQTWLDYIMPGLANIRDDNKQILETAIALPDGVHHDAARYLEVHPFNNTYLLKNPTGLIEGRARVIENLLEKLNPDIVLVVNIVDVYPAIQNLRKKGRLGIKVVTTLHGIHPGIIDDINHYHRCIDAVLTTNKLTSKLVVEKTAIEDTRVLYAPYGVDLQYLDDNLNERIDAENEANERPLTVCYVGRVEEDQKRITDLLKIFDGLLSQRPETRILIAGDGPEKDMRVLNNWLDSQSNSNIQYLGVLSPQQLEQQVYRISDVMLLTSHWETGPIVAWEAFKYGITLVSSRYIGSNEEGSLKHQLNCLMFDIGNIQQAVKMLIQTESMKLRQQLRLESSRLLRSKYSIDISVRTWAKQLKYVASIPTKPHYPISRSQMDKSRALKFLLSLFGDKSYRLYEVANLILKRKFKHQSPGGEWPHSASSVDSRSQTLGQYISERE